MSLPRRLSTLSFNPSSMVDSTSDDSDFYSPCNSSSASTVALRNSSTSSSTLTNATSEISDLHLSFPTLPTEEEDWRQFGYLLDSSDWGDDLATQLQLIGSKNQFRRSNSLPTASICSSMDVEVSSNSSCASDATPPFQPSPAALPRPHAPTRWCDKVLEENKQDKGEKDNEPIAHRTRLSSITNKRKLSNIDLPQDGLPKPKRCQTCVSNHENSCLSPGPSIHDPVEPWWVCKFPPTCPGSDLENSVKKPKNVGRKPPPAMELCDPRYISLGSDDMSNTKSPVLSRSDETTLPTLKSAVREPSWQVKLDELSGNETDESAARSSPTRVRTRASREASSTDGESTPRKRTMAASSSSSPASQERRSGQKICSCGRPVQAKKPHLQCYGCGRQYHRECVNPKERAQNSNNREWLCSECTDAIQRPLFCVCKKPYDGTFYVACDLCDEWYHPACIGTSEENVAGMEVFYCPECSDASSVANSPSSSRKHHGSATPKSRKSHRH